MARINWSWVWGVAFVAALVVPASAGQFGNPLQLVLASAPLPPPEIGLVATGTGFIVNPHGYVLTNEHVICDCEDVAVHVGSGRWTAQVLDSDPDRDIALLKIDADNLAAVELGDPSALRNGATVYAIGCPVGICGTVTQGRVANPAVRVGDVDLIMMDLTITHGNSGGPLVDESGRVVGITSAGLKASEDETSGFSLAVPIDEAMGLLGQVPGFDATTPFALSNAVLDFSEVEALVGPATVYIEADSTRTLELPESYLPPSYGGFLNVRGRLGIVADGFPGSIVRGAEGSCDGQSWEGSQFNYEFTAKNTGRHSFSDRVEFQDTTRALLLEAASASEAYGVAEALAQEQFEFITSSLRCSDLTYCHEWSQTLYATSGEAGEVFVFSGLFFDSRKENVLVESADCTLQYAALAVYDRFIVCFAAERRLNAKRGEFQVNGDTVTLQIDRGDFPLLLADPFEVNVNCMSIGDFTDLAIDEANAIIAFVLQQF